MPQSPSGRDNSKSQMAPPSNSERERDVSALPVDAAKLSIAIRSASVSDADAIVHLVNSAYRGESSQAGWTTEANLLGGQRTDRDAIRNMMVGDEQTVLIYHRNVEGPPSSKQLGSSDLAADPNDDLRHLSACVYLKKKDNTCYLGMLTVSPQLQAGGIGRDMLAAGESWAKANWKSDRVEMTVIEMRSELIAWYERRGYKRTERREPFPSHDPRFGIPLVNNLMFVVLEKYL